MEAHVSAILLAAGRSRRMGTCKQLLPLEGRPLVVRALEPLLAAVGEVVVAVPPQGDAVAAALTGFPVTVVYAEDAAGEMADTIRVALQKTSIKSTAVIISLGDYPLVLPETVALLEAQHHRRPSDIHVPTHRGRKGHPVLFPRPLLNLLGRYPTLRDIMRAHPEAVNLLEVEDPGILIDLDTPEEYENLVQGSWLKFASSE